MLNTTWTKTVVLFVLIFIQTASGSAGDEDYTDQEKQYLLNLARTTLCWYTHNQSIPFVDPSILPVKLKEKKGCFVTLTHKTTGLRGCIGSTIGYEKLYKAVIDKTVAAATHDPRFNAVSYDDIKDLKISVSILSVPRRMYFDTPSQLLDKLTSGKDGVIIKTRYGTSTFLPQVWDMLPDKRQFLSRLCAKHGAPSLIWTNDTNIEVYTYRVISFEEDSYGRLVVGSMGATVGGNGARIIGKAEWSAPDGVTQTADAGVTLDALFILAPESDIQQK